MNMNLFCSLHASVLSKLYSHIYREIKPTLMAVLAKVMPRKSDKNIRKIEDKVENRKF
jgi:hypothetical protein